jgi:hypothetical protein
VYAVITEPIFVGETQLIVTPVFVSTVIVGATGTPGVESATIEASPE